MQPFQVLVYSASPTEKCLTHWARQSNSTAFLVPYKAGHKAISVFALCTHQHFWESKDVVGSLGRHTTEQRVIYKGDQIHLAYLAALQTDGRMLFSDS